MAEVGVVSRTATAALESSKACSLIPEGVRTEVRQEPASVDKKDTDVVEEPGLATFASLEKGASAPWWVFKGICDAWGIDPLESEVTLITVSENITFLVKTKGEIFGVARVSQPGYVGGPQAVESELAWLTALGNIKDVDLVKAIPSMSGDYVAVLNDGSDDWAVICTSFVDGTVLEDLDDPSQYYRLIGHYAAEFHAYARSWNRPEDFKRFSWNLSDMIGPSPRWGRWEDTCTSSEQFLLLKQAEEKAVKVINHTEKNQYTYGLVHADLRPSNIIKRPDGTLTVIDFDDSGFSWYLYDYASALSFVEHEPYAPAMAKEWIAGYREVTPLSDEEIEVASALSMIRRLQMLGWTDNHYPDALPDGLFDAQLPGTITCAKRYLASSTWLLD
ncbi:MAG: phosphotransferase [Eggerthellaceae bacterium]|nr:phosphotransferase [Eggerthellaceae bacterium]MCH4221285.1 phosphotransferase [Eggerthellaceae bacterium]